MKTIQYKDKDKDKDKDKEMIIYDLYVLHGIMVVRQNLWKRLL